MIKKLHIPVKEDLFLSNLTYKDINRQFQLVVKNQHHLGKFLSWVPNSLTKKASEDKIRQDQMGFKDGTSFELGIFLKDNLIGRVGFHTIHNSTAEIGYFLDEDHTRQGIMTESVKALMSYGVKNLSLKTIIIKAHPENISSKNIPKRLGFSFVGLQNVFKIGIENNWVQSEVYKLSIE